MKTGKTLQDLSAEIIRRSATKKDYAVRTDKLTMRNGGDGLRLAIADADDVGINSVAHAQLAGELEIPKRYYDRMLTSAPALLAENVNEWLLAKPEVRTVRTLDKTARAYLSGQFDSSTYENEHVAEFLIPVLADLGVMIVSCDITDTRLYLKCVDEKVKLDLPFGAEIGKGHTRFDTLSPAIVISNSEVGFGAVRVDTAIWTGGCTNLAIAEKIVRRNHVGKRHELGEEHAALLTSETRRANATAFFMTIRDVVRGSFAEAQFQALIEKKLAPMTERVIEADPVKVLDLSQKTFGWTDGERTSVLQHLIKGGDLTQYGLFNAVTRTAEDLDDYDRATEFEKLGGKIIDLSATAWKDLSAANDKGKALAIAA